MTQVLPCCITEPVVTEVQLFEHWITLRAKKMLDRSLMLFFFTWIFINEDFIPTFKASAKCLAAESSKLFPWGNHGKFI